MPIDGSIGETPLKGIRTRPKADCGFSALDVDPLC
jgi:hypothetical protein